MALEQPTEVEKDPHAATWESKAGFDELIPEGHRHVAKTALGGRILATIPPGGRRVRRPSRAGAVPERTTTTKNTHPSHFGPNEFFSVMLMTLL